VTVFAILNILFGIIGFLGSIVSSAMMFVGGMLGDNPVLQAIQTHTSYRVFFAVSLVLGLVFSALLLVSGWGLLKMSKVARRLAIAYGIYAVVAAVVSNVVNFFFIYRPMLEQAAGQQGAQQGIVIVSLVGAVVGGVIGLTFPVALLIYFMMPGVKRAFQTWQAPAA
jgi:hypothetical protein